MPFQSVSDLKQSDLFKRMPSLQQMGAGKLGRFIAVFSRVFERAVRGGASEDEAESRAIPIALTAARQAVFAPAGRTAESDVRYFALMATDMQSGDLMNDSPDLTFPEIEDINDIMAGNAFLGPFTHDRSLAEPQGIIRQAMRRADLPQEIRDKIDPDIQVVVAASFFDDVPEDERFSSISPEWLEMKMADGTTLALPHNFITTPNPANPEFMGIRMVAEQPPTNPALVEAFEDVAEFGAGLGMSEKDVSTHLVQYMSQWPTPPSITESPGYRARFKKYLAKQGGKVEEDPTPFESNEDPLMSDKPDEGLEARIATLSADLESAQERVAAAEAAEKELGSLKARLAGLAGVEENDGGDAAPGDLVEAAETRIATLETTLEKTAAIVEEMKAADRQARAERFAEDLFETKEITAEAKDTWAELYVKDSETAEKMASTLPARALRPGPGKAIANIEVLDEKEAAAHIDFLKEAF